MGKYQVVSSPVITLEPGEPRLVEITCKDHRRPTFINGYKSPDHLYISLTLISDDGTFNGGKIDEIKNHLEEFIRNLERIATDH